ncbi:RNA polymerase sigma factor [Streptomyces mutabilis]|uniref:RNA polymerase sigma factor n=1 Tax=Streptomyces mutabilis TaxID=67332 RepID=UPI0036804939
MAEKYGGATAADLAALYEGHRREMEGFARRLLADERLPESTLSAEDVVQTAFTKALNAPTGIRDPRAYLYVVIRNDVRAASRQVRRQTTATSKGAWQAQSADVHVADFSDLIANRLVVHRALCKLPPQQRTAVWATKALEYTQAEAALHHGEGRYRRRNWRRRKSRPGSHERAFRTGRPSSAKLAYVEGTSRAHASGKRR